MGYRSGDRRLRRPIYMIRLIHFAGREVAGSSNTVANVGLRITNIILSQGCNTRTKAVAYFKKKLQYSF